MFDQLSTSVSNMKKWSCSVLCSGYISTQQLTPLQIDICQYMGTPGDSFNMMGATLTDFRFDEHQFYGPEHFDKLKKYLIQCCREAGFIASATNSCSKVGNSRRLARIEIACRCHHMIHRARKRQSPNFHSTSSQIDSSSNNDGSDADEGKCNFKFIVYCNKSDRRWYLVTDATKEQPSFHYGHSVNVQSSMFSSMKEVCEMCQKDPELTVFAISHMNNLRDEIKKRYHEKYPEAAQLSQNAESKNPPTRKRCRS